VALSKQQLHELARHGAAARIAELRAEIAAITNAFSEVGGRSGARRKPRRAAGTRKRRRMSAAARKAVSQRMTKYWAARRKQKAGAKK